MNDFINNFRINIFYLILFQFLFFSNIAYSQNESGFTKIEIENFIERWIEENPEKIRSVLKKLEEKEKGKFISETLEMLSKNSSEFFIGNKNGEIIVYEFFDYNCGYCKSIFNILLELIKEDSGIKIVLVEFPIFSGSKEISLLVLASKYQNSYGRLHKELMEFNGRINQGSLLKIAGNLGLNTQKLVEDSSRLEVQKILENNKLIAERLGLSGTPSFIIENNLIPGAISKNQFLDIIKNIRENK